MRKLIAVFSLVLACGCGSPTAGIVLVFPNAQTKMFAAHATLQVIQPLATGDECPQFLAYPPLVPMPSQIEQTSMVDITNGVATKPLTQIPVGRQTLLMSISDKGNIFILHGCVTTNVTAGAKVEIPLQPIVPVMADMSTADLATVDMAGPPPDMARHKFLSITVNEMRDSGRKLSGVTVTITDSGTGSVTGMTDATGVVKLDTVGLTPPLAITTSATGNTGFAGAVTLSGVSPTFPANSDTVAFLMPVELDPPATAAPNAITASIGGTVAGQTFNLYWLNTNGLYTDMPIPTPQTVAGNGATATVMTPAIPVGGYRVAVYQSAGGGSPAVATQANVIGDGATFTTATSGGTYPLQNLAGTLTLTVTKSTNATDYNTNQFYGVSLVLPAAPTQAPVPIVAETTPIAGGAGPQAQAAAPVPTSPSNIQLSAFVTSAIIAVGTSARAELRKQYVASVPSTDTLAGLTDPPMVTLTPASPELATAPFTIAVTPPSGFPTSNAFVHVNIKDTGNKYHWHMVAAAASPTNIVVPANIIPAGMYTIDAAVVADFSLADGSVNATLTDDYSKLIRLVPQQLAQRTVNLTVN